MLKVLYELAQSKEYAMFFGNPETDKFKFGYVLAVNENEIAIQELSLDGEDDGIVVMDSNRIYKVERNGQYVDKMMKLSSNKKISDWLGRIDENKILESILLKDVLKDKIVSIELLDSGYYAASGFIDKIQKDQCSLKQIDEYGVEDGMAYFLLSDISELEISSQFEKRIQKLYEINSEKQ